MTQERSTTRRTSRLAGKPAGVAAAAVLLTAVAIAVGQSFGVRAADPEPAVAAPAAAAQASRAPQGKRTVIQRVVVSDTASPSSSATPTPTSTATPAPMPAPTPDGPATPAPTPTSAPSPSAPVPTPSASTPVPAPVTTPSSPPVAMSPGLFGGPAAIASLGSPGTAPVYLPEGQPLTEVLPFQRFRVVVQLGNGGPGDVAVTPRLEYRISGAGSFLVVPENAVPGTPLHAAEEWVPVQGGTQTAPETTTTTPDEARLGAPDGAARVAGHRASGVDTTPAYTVRAGTVTEQEFAVALSVDASYGATYELQVTDAGTAIDGLAAVRVTVADPPPTLQSPGQKQGSARGSIPVLDPATTPPAYQLVSQPPATPDRVTRAMLVQPSPAAAFASTMTATMAAAFVSDTTARAMLTSATTAAAAADPPSMVRVGPAGPATIHDPYSSTTSGQCSVCHQTHSAASSALVKAPSTTQQCFTCHAGGTGGTGGTVGAPDVQAQYTLGQPANDPTTRSYWSHDIADATGHTLDSDNEFAARLNRHSQCTDCHDPHKSSSDAPTMTATGWTAPGALANVTGVAVTNGAAGTTPTYTRLDGTVAPVTAEYQLCFKCHSGYTTLPADVAGKPSQNASDLAVELNPQNASFHPIEAPGRNQSQKLADSLAGSSPYKLWNFSTGDTVRCVSCHSSNTTGTSSDPAQNAPAATSTVHASTNRGILIRPYENRVLSAAGGSYDNQAFALCLTCHMETPFMNRSRPAAEQGTNFVYHGLHMSGIAGEGSGGLDIDTAGAGEGNARCAECHFSSHGTTQPPTDQTLSGDRLVVFGPNVLPSESMGGVPTFTKTATTASCTLTCHGEDHEGATYRPAPAASTGNVPVGG